MLRNSIIWECVTSHFAIMAITICVTRHAAKARTEDCRTLGVR